MKSIFYFFPALFLIGLCIYLNYVSLGNKKEVYKERYVEKITHENHTYLLFHNNWSKSGDNILHDPNCECMKK